MCVDYNQWWYVLRIGWHNEDTLTWVILAWSKDGGYPQNGQSNVENDDHPRDGAERRLSLGDLSWGWSPSSLSMGSTSFSRSQGLRSLRVGGGELPEASHQGAVALLAVEGPMKRVKWMCVVDDSNLTYGASSNSTWWKVGELGQFIECLPLS